MTADPAIAEEMGPGDPDVIADEDLAGSRLLLVRREVAPQPIDGEDGGLVKLACTFQPAHDARFTWARLQLQLLSPDGIVITDLAPREVRGGVVRVSVHRTGKINVSYQSIGVSGDAGSDREFETYHCEVIGSGEGTSLARWDFTEDPDRRLGLGAAQTLVLTLRAHGRITASVVVNARLARAGLRGVAERVRDLVLARSDGKVYTIAFDIPTGT